MGVDRDNNVQYLYINSINKQIRIESLIILKLSWFI
jgi:hypothetical protein